MTDGRVAGGTFPRHARLGDGLQRLSRRLNLTLDLFRKELLLDGVITHLGEFIGEFLDTIKTHCKRVLTAAEETPEKLREEFILAVRKLDKAAAKRIIHPNTAARKKSQLARLLNQKLGAGSTTPPPPQSPP